MFAAIAGALVGGLMQKKAAKDERSVSREDEEEKFVRHRKAAIKGGFNPLTGLDQSLAGFSNLPSGVAPLASTSVVQNAIGSVAEELTSDKEVEETTEKATKEIQSSNAKVANYGGAAPSVRATQEKSAIRSVDPFDHITQGPFHFPGLTSGNTPKPGIESPVRKMGMENVRPPERPGMWSKGSVPMVDPTGNIVQYPRKLADRLKLKPWDLLIGEDYEAIYGDELGQGVSLPKLPASVVQYEGGVTRVRSIEERKEIIDDPYKWGSYLPSLNNGKNYRRSKQQGSR